MSGIKTINDVLPAVKRPYRLQDLQDVWQGMNTALAEGTTDKPRIISGFNNVGGVWSSGVIAFNGQLYVYSDASPINVGATVYAKRQASGDLRIFADQTEQTFSFDNVVTTDPAGATQIGVVSVANVSAWKTQLIPSGSLLNEKLAPGSVTRTKLSPDIMSARYGTLWVTFAFSKRAGEAIVDVSIKDCMSDVFTKDQLSVANVVVENTGVLVEIRVRSPLLNDDAGIYGYDTAVANYIELYPAAFPNGLPMMVETYINNNVGRGVAFRFNMPGGASFPSGSFATVKVGCHAMFRLINIT